MYILLIMALWGDRPVFEQVRVPSEAACLSLKAELIKGAQGTNINQRYIVMQCVKGE